MSDEKSNHSFFQVICDGLDGLRSGENCLRGITRLSDSVIDFG